MTDAAIEQKPKEVSLGWVVGDALRFSLTVKDPDPDSPDPENPVMIPRNLTGWTVAAQIRKTTKLDEPLLAEFVFNVLGNDGVVDAYLTPIESQKLDGIRAARWDFQLTDPDGDPQTLMAGPAGPIGQVTR